MWVFYVLKLKLFLGGEDSDDASIDDADVNIEINLISTNECFDVWWS